MSSTPTKAPALETVTACVLCGGASSSLWRQVPCPERPDEVFDIVECQDCGLRYTSPRPTLEALGAYYEADYYSYQFCGVPPRSQRLKVAAWRGLGLLRGAAGAPVVTTGPWAAVWRGIVRVAWGARAPWLLPAPRGGRFLDLGCGAGDRLEWARELGWETFGVDVGEAAVAAAAARGHRTVAGDVAALPFADGVFAYVSLSHVLEHAQDPVAALREVGRVLQPGGTAQVVVPNAGSQGARRYGVAWAGWQVPRHLFHFEERTLRQAALQAGLSVRALVTVPNASLLQDSARAAGESNPPAAGRDDGNLCLWCTR